MHRKVLFFLGLLAFPAGCAQNPGSYSAGGAQIKVKSKPAGAEVYVMGDLLGLTPLEFPASRVFPVVYPPEKQQLYGRVVLVREGCIKKTVPVSTGRLASGIHVKLQCQQSGETGEMDIKTRPLRTKQRLMELQELLKNGLISKPEYNEIRQRILKSH